jgi:RNase P subunit RPR2
MADYCSSCKKTLVIKKRPAEYYSKKGKIQATATYCSKCGHIVKLGNLHKAETGYWAKKKVCAKKRK